MTGTHHSGFDQKSSSQSNIDTKSKLIFLIVSVFGLILTISFEQLFLYSIVLVLLMFVLKLSLAELMKQTIENEYALPVRWVETLSHTTYENAKYSTETLKADGIESIYLVTHAAHMKRSVMSFEKFGLTVHPAPTAFGSTGPLTNGLYSFLPNANALRRTALVFHEWVGMIWYWLRY